MNALYSVNTYDKSVHILRTFIYKELSLAKSIKLQVWLAQHKKKKKKKKCSQIRIYNILQHGNWTNDLCYV